VDNGEEMCATHVSRAVKLKKPLILTHQIDTCTEGWLGFLHPFDWKQYSSQKEFEDICANCLGPVFRLVFL
jgi:hypothetical protein